MQAIANMLGEKAHILHNKLWLPKYLRVDALQNEAPFYVLRIQAHQESIIDIAMSIFLDVYHLALWFKLVCNGNKIIQGFISCKAYATSYLCGINWGNSFKLARATECKHRIIAIGHSWR